MSLDKSRYSPIFDGGDVIDEDVLTDEQYSESKIRIRKAPEMPYLDVENGNGVYGNWLLVGHGEVTNEKCGVFSKYWGCDREDLHKLIKLDGASYEGKVYVRMGHHYCYKPSCPKCFKHGYAVRAADRINARVQEARKKFGDFEHIVISVPPKDYGLSYDTLKKKVNDILIARGIIGGCKIFHGFRFATRKESLRRGVPEGWYWSPHFHVIGRILGGYSRCRNCKFLRQRDCQKGCGNFFDRNYWNGYMKDGYYLKVLGPRNDFFATAWYQLNHASYDKTKKRANIVTWFGVCSRRKMKVTPEKKKQLCPICNHELKPVRYVGCDPITFSWLTHDGYFDYYDSKGNVAWIDAPEKHKSNSGSHRQVHEEQEFKLHEAIELKDRVIFRVKEGHGDLDKYTKEEKEAFNAYMEDMFPKGGNR